MVVALEVKLIQSQMLLSELGLKVNIVFVNKKREGNGKVNLSIQWVNKIFVRLSPVCKY